MDGDALLHGADGEQVRMMEEQVILVDYFDRAIGSGSKKETHLMKNINAGMLHRAFSVFLFSPDGKLYLQQRSEAKITFPLIWANTCCSHPLSIPSELIEEAALGVKNAARRKLEHELGIPPEDVPLDSFTYITRVHYAGSSTRGLQSGEEPVWGEHEIDWILICTPKQAPRFNLNPNEVAQVRAFTQPELRAWMASRHERGDEVSPWFGVMEKALLYKWWDAVLAGRVNSVLERDVIHREHDLIAMASGKAVCPMPVALAASLNHTHATAAAYHARAAVESAEGVRWSSSASSEAVATHDATTSAAAAAGAAAANASIPGASAAVPKQGAYGKVRIHSESLLAQLSHPDEVMAALRYKMGMIKVTKVAPLSADAPSYHIFCEKILVRVSRSFAMVIQQLPEHLRMSICVFYLVLRGLDTVEDDMQAFTDRHGEKLQHLRNFHLYLRDPLFAMRGVGEGDEAHLLAHFYHVVATFASLPAVDQVVIADICARMGAGMADYSGRDLREGTTDLRDYNLYCHYVAGLVGEGLSRLWVAHGDEAAIVAEDVKLADDMGLFLQKTNIIRDYLEDLVDGRAFWPREIWSQYSPGLANLRYKVAAAQAVHRDSKGSRRREAPDAQDDAMVQEDQAVACLNHLVADALTLAPSCLTYLARLRQPDVFRFCAIPQVMAAATLAKVANNADVFTGVVKIRKGEALVLMSQGAQDITSVYSCFLKHSRAIADAIPPHHTTAYAIAQQAAADVEAIVACNLPADVYASIALPNTVEGNALRMLTSPWASLLALAALAYLLRHLYLRSSSHAWGDSISVYAPRITDSWDVAALAAVVFCVTYLLACAGVPLVMRLSTAELKGTAKLAGSEARAAVAAKTE